MFKILNELNSRELEILNTIQKNGPLTKKALQVMEDIKLTTLNRIMCTLEDKKLIVEFGESESTGGRKPVEYDVSPKGFYIIGVDISRTYVKLILTNMKLDILKKREFVMDKSCDPEKTVSQIVLTIEQMLSDLNIEKSEVYGIGIGTVGPLDREKGIMLNPKGFFNEHWTNVPLKAMFEERLSIPCYIDNGANTAVLAEFFYGKGKGSKSTAYIHFGVGIRSAVIMDGRIIRTMNDAEDAFAHMIVDYNGDECSCGSRGCLECYSSVESIMKKINFKVKDKNNDSEIIEPDYWGILKSEYYNNKTFEEALNKGAEISGVGISNLVRLINPDIVILSGPLMMNFQNYYDKCIETFYNINSADNRVIFNKGGKFQDDVIAMGAAAAVMEVWFKKPWIL